MLLNILKARDQKRAGNALLDAALVLPILLSLSFGTVEYGYFFFVKHSLQGAAREGARVAILSTADNNQVRQAVASSLYAAGLNSSQTSLDGKFTLTLEPGNVSGLTTGTPVRVSVEASWGAVGVRALPRALGGIDPAKIVRGTTVMRRE